MEYRSVQMPTRARLEFEYSSGMHFSTYMYTELNSRIISTTKAVLLDTKGPEIRSGFFADGKSKIELVKGETLILTTDYSFLGDSTKLACSYESLPQSVTPGQQILVADGSLVLTVLSCDVAKGEISTRIDNNASIGERKNMNLPGVVVDLPTLTEKDVDDIVNFGIKHNVDFIAASFVRKGSDVHTLRKLLADNGGKHIKIICKIENLEGLENYDEILEATDSIMVARGDLGMEIPPAKVFLAQKMMIREANILGKPVITATQMLESMITNPRPTRAECSDVANAVYDGSDCVMLSGETANGPYFEQAIRVMARTAAEAESSQNFNALFQSIRNSVARRATLSVIESLASSAVKTAIDVSAALILVISETGNSALNVAKFRYVSLDHETVINMSVCSASSMCSRRSLAPFSHRPGCHVICLTADETVARQASGLYKGVHAYVVDSLNDTVALTAIVGKRAIEAGIAKEGDHMVVVCGLTAGPGHNTQIEVQCITSGSAPASDGHAAVGSLSRGLSFSV